MTSERTLSRFSNAVRSTPDSSTAGISQCWMLASCWLAGKLGVKPADIKFDKFARKLISPDGNTILATQSLSTWRVTIMES